MAENKLVWLITGVNSGFGLLLAELALSQGHTVVGTVRNLANAPSSLTGYRNLNLIETDINVPGSQIKSIVDAAVSRHGRIDVLVNNAGFGHVGAVEEVSEEEARYQFDINFFGVYNLCRAAIPHMRAQSSGVIIQVSSGTGILAAHGGPVYAASKFAVEGLGESMAQELKPFGIRVHIVEPGIFRTDFLRPATQGKNMGEKKKGYVDIGGIVASMHDKQPGDPQKGVQRIFEIVTGTGMATGFEDQLRFPLGSDCYGMLQMKLQSLDDTAAKMRSIAVSTDY